MSKRFYLFYTKNLLFLFYIITFTKHLHQFIYYIHFFIKIIFLHPFSIISHLTPTSFFFESEYTPIFILFSLSLSPPLFLLFLFFFFFFLRIFFFPLLLLQFEFYAFIMDDDFGLGLIKVNDFGWRKQSFGLGFSSLASSSFFLSSSPSFFNFSLIIYMNLDLDLEQFWWFCGLSVMILGWVSQWVLINFKLGFPVGLSWFWVGFSNCSSVDFGLIFCARLRCLVVVLGLVVGWSFSSSFFLFCRAGLL